MTKMISINDAIEALRTIAATRLWGERIDDLSLRDDYAETAQDDIAEDIFEPCCDTESTQLRDAVEKARDFLKLLEG